VIGLFCHLRVTKEMTKEMNEEMTKEMTKEISSHMEKILVQTRVLENCQHFSIPFLLS
jgi:hypothetical protein